MSAIWTGSRVSVARPITPSPLRSGIARSVSTNAVSKLCVALTWNVCVASSYS